MLSKCPPIVNIVDIYISKPFTFGETDQVSSSILVDKGITGALSEYKARPLGGKVALGACVEKLLHTDHHSNFPVEQITLSLYVISDTSTSHQKRPYLDIDFGQCLF